MRLTSLQDEAASMDSKWPQRAADCTCYLSKKGRGQDTGRVQLPYNIIGPLQIKMLHRIVFDS
jgi:hypothetical protein